MGDSCYALWGNLLVDTKGALSPCCFSTLDFGNLRDYGSIHEAYNSSPFVEARRHIIAGQWKAAGCDNCKLLQVNGFGVRPDETSEQIELLPSQTAAERNFRQNLAEYFSGTTILASNPCDFTVTVTHRCNIDCLMCWQRDLQGRFDTAEIGEDLLEVMTVALEKAKSIHWVGGEPFVSKIVRRFIAEHDLTVNPGLRVMATTNGLLLTSDVLEPLARFKNVTLVMSIDGVSKEVYEYVRRGGRWETLCENVEKVSAIARERGWNAQMNFVVMCANFHEIPAAVDFARKYRLAITFDSVSGSRLTTENLFEYPVLLYKVPQWRIVVEEGIRRAQAEGLQSPFYQCVKSRLEHIRKLLTEGEQRVTGQLLSLLALPSQMGTLQGEITQSRHALQEQQAQHQAATEKLREEVECLRTRLRTQKSFLVALTALCLLISLFLVALAWSGRKEDTRTHTGLSPSAAISRRDDNGGFGAGQPMSNKPLRAVGGDAGSSG